MALFLAKKDFTERSKSILGVFLAQLESLDRLNNEIAEDTKTKELEIENLTKEVSSQKTLVEKNSTVIGNIKSLIQVD